MARRSAPLAATWIAAGLACCRVAMSDELFSQADESYFLDESVPIVLSATRLAQPQYETPASVTIIDRDMIRASGALDIPDLLRLVPGFQVGRARIHTISASYHGLADERARRMQVLIDGRPVYGPANGGVRWMELPLDISDVERIEVIRGPNAAAYGANSFLGAINIITQHPSELHGTQAGVLAGNKGNRKALLRHGGSRGRLDYRFTLAWRKDDGFETRTDPGPPEPGKTNREARKPLADGMRFPLFDLRTEYRLSNTASLEFLAGYNGGVRRDGAFDEDIDSPREDRITSHFQQLVYHHSPGADRETRFQLYHTYMRNSSMTIYPIPDALRIPLGLAPGAAIVTDFGITEQRLEAELVHHRSLSSDLRFVAGGSARLDRVRGRNWFSREDFIVNHLYRLFGNLEYHPMPRGVLNLGLMVEKSSQVGTRLSPRIAYNHQLTPNHGLRASLSRAYRLPTIYEEHIDGSVYLPDGRLFNRVYLGNENLDPESLTSFEIGYLGRFPEFYSTIDIKLFLERLENRITSAKNWPETGEIHPGQRTLRFINSPGDSFIRGIELSCRWRPTKDDMLLFNWNYSDIDGNYLKDFGPSPYTPSSWLFRDIDNQVPRHTYSLFFMHRLPGNWEIGALYYRTDSMKWLGDGDYLGPQDRLDLRIARTFRLNGAELEASLVAQNVLDEYLEFRDENVFDTRVYGQLLLSLY